ncbi:MAG: HlyD family efflux transporter periplasmic adaptor subunit [Lachnospiraceae bacterium]|nr:HlyD family efflux transporter periplasmic adaptor subunit [Lachnospiraceae bacterium]
MKPIILNMNDMSDSTEVYESKPNRFLIYTIYLILLIIVVAIAWMGLSKMDIVVKSIGIFKGDSAVYEVSCGITGNVEETYIVNGQYVNEGDVLYLLNIEELSDTIIRYQDELEAAKDRIEILSAYEKSIDGDKSELDGYSKNPYYNEFINRRELLFANVSMNTNDSSSQISIYQGSVESISNAIEKYTEKIDKLGAVKQCVTERNNIFSVNESDYYSMVNSYIASYNFTSLQYDNKINEYQRQIDEYDEKIKTLEIELSKYKESANNSDIINEANTTELETLKKQRETLISTCESVKTEKTQALMNLELQQITTIDQQISGYNDTILSLNTNLTSAKLQLDTVNDTDTKTEKSVAILTEKGNIAAEILSYKDKLNECENYLKSYSIQNDKCVIKANVSGYFYASTDIKNGSIIQEGASIGAIYPETESKYYAEIYVENSDIAKIAEGQKVKFEIAAYPSSEYGYFEGTVENISKDISVDQNTGYAYYIVRVKCNNITLKGKNGEEASLVNGMACQAKIIVDEKNVLSYLLEKIDLLD